MRVLKYLFFAVLITIVIGFIIKTVSEQQEKEAVQRNPKNCLLVVDNGYMYNSTFGGISNAKFSVLNNCSIAIKDVRVLVSYIRKNGNLYKQSFVDIPFVDANGSISSTAPDSDAGMSIMYEIYSANSL